MTERMDLIERALKDNDAPIGMTRMAAISALRELRAEVAAQQAEIARLQQIDSERQDACYASGRADAEDEIAALQGLIAEAQEVIAGVPGVRTDCRMDLDTLRRAYIRLAAVGNAGEQEAKWNRTTKATGDLVE